MRICPECQQPVSTISEPCAACGYAVPLLDGFYAYAPELARQNDHYEAEFFATLLRLEAGSFWFKARNKMIAWALETYFPQAATFLEIGCGTGFVLSHIRQLYPSLAVSGSDIFTEGLGFAATRLPGVELFQLDARDVPFVDAFDVIGAFDVLEHIEEDELVLKELYKATAPGGGIVISVPQHRFLWSQADNVAHHVRRYTARELKEKTQGAGFKVLRHTSFVSLLLPMMLASRLKPQKSGQNRVAEELEMGSALSTVLEKIMDFERQFIRAGVSFPVGGSLLMVAQKR